MYDHSLCEQSREGLIHSRRKMLATAGHEPREVPRIEKMQNGMLNSADVLVNAHPVIRVFAHRGRRRVRCRETHEIPGGIDERIHRVGFAFGIPSAGRAGNVFPSRMPVKGIARSIEDDVVRKRDGKVRLRNRHNTAFLAVDHGHRAAPIALARNSPVPESVGDIPAADACGFRAAGNLRFRLLDRHSVQERGIPKRARTEIRLVGNVERCRLLLGRDHDGITGSP